MTKATRRRLLAATASSLSLAGCIQLTAEQSWKDADEYPNDENRNRKCEIRSSGPTSGTIDSSPSELGYAPFLYTLPGREDMHGTNQHYEATVTADADIRIIRTTADQPANTMVQPDQSSLDRPNSSEIIEEHALPSDKTYSGTWEIADNEGQTVMFIPDGTMNGPISVQLDLECSYYLPLDEYKERAQ